MQRKAIERITVATLLLATGAVWAAPPSSSVSNLWRLAYEENFDGAALNPAEWTINDGCSGVICRHPENIEVSGGFLLINTLEANPLVDPPEVDYTTGRVDTTFQLNSGYVEVSSRAAADSGIQSSVFTTGDVRPNVTQAYEDDSNDGLVDWNFVNGVDGAYQNEFVFTSADPFPGATDLSAAFHTYALRWTEAGELIWSADGGETARTQIPIGLAPSPSTIAIGSAIRNEDFGIPRNPLGTAMEVDYLRVYQKRDICLGCDGFDYPGGDLDGRNGGQGWDGPWAVTSGTVEVEGLGNNLTVSGITLPAVAGERFLGVAGDIAVRPLGTGVSLGANGSYYVSVLVNKSDDGDFQISFRRSSDNAVRWFFGGDADEAAVTGVQTPGTAANAFPADETVLVVAKVDTVASGNDTTYIAVFRDGDAIPTNDGDVNWDRSAVGNSGITMNYMDIDVFAGSVEIDEIKVGTSLADVLTVGGAPSAAESFDYADATLDFKNGGSGWGGEWLASAMLSTDDTSLDYPASPSTETLSGYGDTLVITDGAAERTVNDSFSFAEDNTYFMSFLAQKGAAGDLLVEALDNSNNSRWRVGLRGINEVLGGVATTASSGDNGAVPAGSLSYPPSVPLSTNGSRIVQDGPGSAGFGLSSTVPVSPGAPTSVWLSFLARKSADGVFAVRVARATDDIARWNVEVGADGAVRAEIFAGASSAPGVFPNDESVLVISEFVGDSAPADKVRIAVISQGEPLPADAGSIVWDAEVTDSTSITMNKLIVDVLTGLVEIDEIRYGNTYESVTATDTGLIDADSISYPGGPIGGQGPWSGNLEVAGTQSDSLAYPALTPAIPFTPAGGRIDHTGAGSATFQPLAVTVSPEAGFTRWISFLAQKSADGEFAVRTQNSGNGAARWNVEVLPDGSVRSEIFSGAASAPGLFPNDETVLVISRFTGDTTGADMVDTMILRDGDPLPASETDIDTNGLWDISHTDSTSVSMDALVIDVIAGRVQIDEWRYGNTYESVTTSGSNLFQQRSFSYPGGPIGDNDGWTGDLNVSGPMGGFAGDTVFVLSMFQAREAGGADTDTVYVKVFRSAEELPLSAASIANWDLTASGNTGIFMNKIRVSATGGDPVLLDELKVGTTYASVTGFELPGDCDGDGDVDLTDYADCFAPCLAGPETAIDESCTIADLDGDGDVDLRDFALFGQLF